MAVDYLAAWGAVTGTVGASVALFREYLTRKRSLQVAPGIQLNVSRTSPGEVNLAWALVRLVNTGGRPIAVEHVGFKYNIEQPNDPVSMDTERRAEIFLESAITLPVDGASESVYTPLGPMLAAGISPVHEITAFALDSRGHEWEGIPQPLLRWIPPISTPEQLFSGLERIGAESESAPTAGNLLWLQREQPYLPDPETTGENADSLSWPTKAKEEGD